MSLGGLIRPLFWVVCVLPNKTFRKHHFKKDHRSTKESQGLCLGTAHYSTFSSKNSGVNRPPHHDGAG
jgi:hypothetical protein